MNDSLNNKELVAVGHQFAKAMSSDTPIIDMAKIVSRLAERLDCTTAALREMTKQRDALAAPAGYRLQPISEYDGMCAAMLQGAAGNSPAIPDGYALVPVDPTEEMIIQGFESEPDESFSDENEWEAYNAMSGCKQAAHRAKLCWAAMIAASQKS
ncbi:TPA: hypothetical protein J5G41_003896 [Escherichia coli]|nr:hypothetical protein [Escherichia coli]HBA4352458.1 hypothetical protein [Escherichia coli]